mgnify:CR=1 FL=1|tara:strand:+ start:4480 stop:4863 length:384 start_codon:yes stop_codon:yes gene_type:complete
MAEENKNEVPIDSNGPVPEVEVTFGYASFGKYELIFYDKEKKDTSVKGRSGDNESDTYKHKLFGSSVSDLNNCYLTWDLTVIDQSSKSYYAEVKITQGGTPIRSFKYEGELKEGVFVVPDYLKFKVN